MPILKRIFGDLHERALLENAEAEVDNNAAKIDYIAMMCDVDIPTEDENDVTEI